MKRALLRSRAFIRDARRVARRSPELAPEIRAALILLEADAFHPALKTHKLKGKLVGSWACAAAYDLRIIFTFMEHEGGEAVLLEAIGTHDEVY